MGSCGCFPKKEEEKSEAKFENFEEKTETQSHNLKEEINQVNPITIPKQIINNYEEEYKQTIKIQKIKKNKRIKSSLFQLQLKNDYYFEILSIHKLANKKVGVLSEKSLLIYSQNTFKPNYEITLDYSIIKGDIGEFKDFIELKNSNLLLWTSKSIAIYKLLGKKYEIYQFIKEKEGQEELEDIEIGLIRYESRDEYILNSVYELANNKLVSCNSNGLNIYSEENNKYILKSNHKIQYGVKHIIEINPNKLILFQIYHYFYWGCSMNNYSSHTYIVSIYDIEQKTTNEFVKHKVDKYNYMGKTKLSYVIKNKFLFIRYGYKIDIFNMEQNMKLVNSDQEENIKSENHYGYNIKMLKDEMNIEFLCDYIDNLIIAKDLNNNIKIYKFDGNSLKYYKDFPIQMKEIIGIIKMKNNKLIMYSGHEIYLINHIKT